MKKCEHCGEPITGRGTKFCKLECYRASMSKEKPSIPEKNGELAPVTRYELELIRTKQIKSYYGWAEQFFETNKNIFYKDDFYECYAEYSGKPKPDWKNDKSVSFESDWLPWRSRFREWMIEMLLIPYMMKRGRTCSIRLKRY